MTQEEIIDHVGHMPTFGEYVKLAKKLWIHGLYGHDKKMKVHHHLYSTEVVFETPMGNVKRYKYDATCKEEYFSDWLSGKIPELKELLNAEYKDICPAFNPDVYEFTLGIEG